MKMSKYSWCIRRTDTIFFNHTYTPRNNYKNIFVYRNNDPVKSYWNCFKHVHESVMNFMKKNEYD